MNEADNYPRSYPPDTSYIADNCGDPYHLLASIPSHGTFVSPVPE